MDFLRDITDRILIKNDPCFMVRISPQNFDVKQRCTLRYSENNISKANKTCSPIEQLLGRENDLSKILVRGCSASTHKAKQKRKDMLTNRRETDLFVGVQNGSVSIVKYEN